MQIYIISALSILTAIFISTTALYYVKFRNMIKVIAQLIIDKEIMADRVEQILLETSNETNEGFIKFLSDSRESAFNYIEDVQNAIQAYLAATENGNADEIATARMELFSHLPEDSENQSK